MKFLKAFFISAMFLQLFGCASQQNVGMTADYWASKDKKVGIIITQLPAPTGMKAGNQGLLDMAINEAIGDPLDKHLGTLKLDGFGELGEQLSMLYESKGISVTVIDEHPVVNNLPDTNKGDGFSQRDFTALAKKHNVDQILVVNVQAAGTIRSYYGFIPTSDPAGYCLVNASLIEAKSHKLLWNFKSEQKISVAGEWDQPDAQFPNITTSFYKAVDMSTSQIFSDFSKGT